MMKNNICFSSFWYICYISLFVYHFGIYMIEKNKIKNSIHPKPQTDTQPSLPPIRNNFYPELPQSDDDITNVYIPQ